MDGRSLSGARRVRGEQLKSRIPLIAMNVPEINSGAFAGHNRQINPKTAPRPTVLLWIFCTDGVSPVHFFPTRFGAVTKVG
jgi:hypothetical protein